MKSYKILLSTLSIGLFLSAPAAFAQDAASAAQPQTAASPMQSQAQPASPTAGQPPGAQPRQITWSDLDTDKDGKLSKTEAAPVQALTQVFASAVTDKDGALTPDEYKAYVAKNAAGTTGASGSNGG